MRNSSFFFILIAIGAGIPGLAWSEDRTLQVPPPTEPLVRLINLGAHWKITLRYKAPEQRPLSQGQAQPSSEGPVLLPNRSEYWRDIHNVGHIVVTYTSGDQREAYSTGDQLFVKNQNGIVPTSSPDIGDVALAVFYIRGYPGTSWMTMAHYQAPEQLNGRMCYKFHRNAVPSDVYTPEATAWIAVNDKSPVRVILGDETLDYSPIENWNGQVQPPADVLAKMLAVSRTQAALEVLRRMNSN